MRTYDPIVEVMQLRRMRFAPLPPPPLGQAMVLVAGDGTLVTVKAGSAVPNGWFGGYRTAYLIDTSDHHLAIPEQLPSADPAFVFQAVISCFCRVGQPEVVAARQLRDIGLIIRAALIPPLHAASSRYDVSQSAEAQAAMARSLREIRFEPVVELTGLYVELPVHADEAQKSGRALRDATRRERLLSVAREPLRRAIESGQPGLLAHHLAMNPGDTGAAVEMIAGGEILESEQMLRAISLMVGAPSKDDEAFETWEARKALMDRFVSRALSSRRLSGATPALGAGAGRDATPAVGSGSSRVKGSLGGRPGWDASDPADASVIDAEVVDDTADDRSGPEPRPRPSRLRLPRSDGGPSGFRDRSTGRDRSGRDAGGDTRSAGPSHVRTSGAGSPATRGPRDPDREED